MVVMPNEITKAGKLDSTKRVVGRIVEVEEKEANYTCYLICGTNRRETLQIDAWQEQKGTSSKGAHGESPCVHHQRDARSAERRQAEV